MADAAWTPPTSDAVWTPPADDAVDNAPSQTVGGAGQAVASGLQAGIADVAGLPVDTARNVTELGKAAAGYLYHETTGKPIPDALAPMEDRSQDVGSSDWIKEKARKALGASSVDVQEPTNLNWYAHAGSEGVAPALIGSEGGAVGALKSAAAGATANTVQQAAGDVGADAGTGAAASMLAGALAHRAMQPGAGAAPKTPSPSPDVGEPLSGDDLRAQPNPVPFPEGTLHRTMSEAGNSPAAPKSQPSAPGGVTLPESDNAPVDMSLSPEQRALVREGVAARRAAQENAPAAPSAEAGGTTVAPTPTNAAPEPSPAVAAGSLFNEPAKTGPQEKLPPPEEQVERAGHLDALDNLSNGGLPTRRESAIKGDYNATGDDYQAKEVGSGPMRQQVASENAALHTAAGNVHNSIGSEFSDSVDSQTLDNRGRVIRNAIQGIEGWFDKATDDTYDEARAVHGNQPLPQFLTRADDFLKDDANYMPEGFRRSAQARLQQLKTVGDKGDGTPNSAAGPGSVGAAEKFREWLNGNRTMDNAHTVKQLKDHVDTDVSEQGGPGLFTKARAMRTHQAQMLEEPAGIKKLLAPSDSQGINHAIPTHKVADYISDLPTDQHAHVMNVLKAGAHLGTGELADASAAAIRELQAHVASRMHAAGTNADGTWNARTFYNSANQYARNAPKTFEDRPDVLKNLKILNDAGNTLAMDKHYPGSAAQTERTGLGSRAVTHGGNFVASLAHEIPVAGRFIGRGIENAVEKTTGHMDEAARDRAVQSRLIDRNGNRLGSGKPMNPPASGEQPLGARVGGGKMRGAVGDLSQRDAIQHEKDTRGEITHHRYSVPGNELGPAGQMHVTEYPEKGVSQVSTSRVVPSNRGQGWGTRMLQRAADDAHARGQVLHSDAQVSDGAAGAYSNLKKLGYDVTKKDADHTGGAYHAVGDHVFEVRPRPNSIAPGQLNVPPGQRGAFSFQNDNQLNNAASRNKQRGGSFGVERNPRSEYNANDQLAGGRPMSDEQRRILGRLSGQTGAAGDIGKQSTAGSRNKQRGGTLNIGLNQGNKGEPGFRQMSKQEATGAVESTGAKVTKASVLTPEKHGVYEPTVVADTDRPLSAPEMQQVLAKTKQSAIPQRTPTGDEMHVAPGHEQTAKEQGWDKFNSDYFRNHNGTTATESAGEKPLEGAPEGDRPNGKARAAAEAYKKSAGIDTPPLQDYRYIDPKVAKSVGDAYEAMKHDPTDPKVKKSYDEFKSETLAQYKQMQKAGVKVDLDKDYPYTNPRDMHADVRDNNHMSIYPTEEGFGSSDAAPSNHPMMEKAPVKMGGKDATYNDLFRAVHDYYGHAAEGNGFRANGEYNAWRAHRQMYSPEARGAMDSETLGQNSWVNSGPPAALNKGASSADTIYADQKAGLLPKDVVKKAEAGVGADEHHVTNQLTDDERNQLRADSTKRLVEAFHGAPAAHEYAAAALAGAAKRGWYKNSSQAIVNQFGHEAPRFAALLSAMSPQVSVQTNFANALKTYINWDNAGRPEDPASIRSIMEKSSQKSAKAAPGQSNVLDAWVNNSVRALTADDPSNVKLSGPKVHSFYNNLTDKVNEVTNDAWMASFAKIDPAKLGGGLTKSGPGKSATYLALSGKVRQAASMLSRMTGETWTPAEVQETVWSWAKTAYEHAEEKGDRSIPDLVKNGDITDELIRSTPDFHQLFSSEQHRGLLQSSRFAGNDERVAAGSQQGANAAGPSEASKTAAASLRHHLLSAAERLEQVRQERRAAGKAAPKDESED
jgi:hypothetical protein